jgi:hypothetical protein
MCVHDIMLLSNLSIILINMLFRQKSVLHASGCSVLCLQGGGGWLGGGGGTPHAHPLDRTLCEGTLQGSEGGKGVLLLS